MTDPRRKCRGVHCAGVSGAAEANDAFSPAFDAAYTAILQRKLGLSGMELGSGWIHPARSGGAASDTTTGEVPSDAKFVLRLFRLMSECRTDYTETWRALLDVPALSMTCTGQKVAGERSPSGAHVAEGLDDERQGPASSAGGARDSICGDDEEVLRPFRAVLKTAGASSTQMREWAIWVREYSSRIATQGIGRSHPEGEEDGRAERLETMRNTNPDFVLRGTYLEEALRAAEKDGERSCLSECGLSQSLAAAQFLNGGRLLKLKLDLTGS